MGSVDANGRLARHADDHIAAMVYALIGDPSEGEKLRYQLELAHKSLQELHAQLTDLQLRCRGWEYKCAKAKDEASLNAVALKRKIGEYDVLKGNFEQLLKECELYRIDREVFAEAADDAEERRAEADRRAAEAEHRAAEAEQRERAALRFVEDMLGASPAGKAQASPHAEVKGTPLMDSARESSDTSSSIRKSGSNAAQNTSQVNHVCQSPTSNGKQAGSVETAAARSPSSGLSKESRGPKRVLFDACKGHDDNTGVLRRRTCKGVLMERSKPMGESCKIGRIHPLSTHEKENFNFLETDAGVGIEQAAQSDNAVVRHLADLVMIAKENLRKAEAEGDIIHAKYCELHKLLMDTLVTFGILPEICQGKMVRSEDSTGKH